MLLDLSRVSLLRGCMGILVSVSFVSGYVNETWDEMQCSIFFAEVAYYHIVEEWMKGPTLMSRKGRYAWSGGSLQCICCY